MMKSMIYFSVQNPFPSDISKNLIKKAKKFGFLKKYNVIYRLFNF